MKDMGKKRTEKRAPSLKAEDLQGCEAGDAVFHRGGKLTLLRVTGTGWTAVSDAGVEYTVDVYGDSVEVVTTCRILW